MMKPTRAESGLIDRVVNRHRLFASRIAWLAIMVGSLLTLSAAETPITPNASPEAHSLLAYFSDIYGRNILSGQQEGSRGTNDLGFELRHITNTTGKLPAVLGLDFIACTEQAPGRDTTHAAAKTAIDWYNNRNGIVTFCWHWYAPTDEKAFYTKDTRFDFVRGTTEGTPQYAAVIRDLDAVAGELKLLRDARVPVLWRPMHEVNGRWFWWGAYGPEPYKKLWRLMFDRFTYQHGLTNLLWVFSPGASTDLADWYPGDAYVDMIGQDHYPMDGNDGPAKDVFDELSALGRGAKLLGMSENGPIPDPDRLVSEKADWLFFITWSGRVLTERNPPEKLARAYNHPHVLNLDDLPDLKRYPFRQAGKPAALGFPASVGDVSVNATRRLPVTVAVLDEAGRIVREGRFEVSLRLAANSRQARLDGVTTVQTVNGVATFPDLTLDKPGDGYTLLATASGLRSATSEPFGAGPGAGVLREWWTNANTGAVAELSVPSQPPSGSIVLGKAFEAPAIAVTNFSARFRGSLLPPLDGSYTFWLANDGRSELWLSSDHSPEKKLRIAAVTANTPYSKWPHTSESESKPITLSAGKRYYIEVLQKQDAGLGHLSLRWRLPNGVDERPIPGYRFMPPE